MAGSNIEEADDIIKASNNDLSSVSMVLMSTPLTKTNLSNSFNSVVNGKKIDGGYAWLIFVVSCISMILIDGTALSTGLFQVQFEDVFQSRCGLAPCGRARLAISSALFCGLPLLFGPLAAALAHEIGARFTTILGGILSAVGCLLSYFLVVTPEHLSASFGVCAGLGLACVHTPVLLVAAHYFQRRRALIMGLLAAASNAAVVIISPLICWLLSVYGWRGSLLLVGGLLLQLCVCGAFLRPLDITAFDEAATLLFKKKCELLRRLERLSIESGLADSLTTLEYCNGDIHRKLQTLSQLLKTAFSDQQLSIFQGEPSSTEALLRDSCECIHQQPNEISKTLSTAHARELANSSIDHAEVEDLDSGSENGSCSSSGSAEYQLTEIRCGGGSGSESGTADLESLTSKSSAYNSERLLATYFPDINIAAVSDTCNMFNENYRIPFFYDQVLATIPEDEPLRLCGTPPSPEPALLAPTSTEDLVFSWSDRYSATLDLSNSALDNNVSPFGSRGRSLNGLFGTWGSGSGFADQLSDGRCAGGISGSVDCSLAGSVGTLSIRRWRSADGLQLYGQSVINVAAAKQLRWSSDPELCRLVETVVDEPPIEQVTCAPVHISYHRKERRHHKRASRELNPRHTRSGPIPSSDIEGSQGDKVKNSAAAAVANIVSVKNHHHEKQEPTVLLNDDFHEEQHYCCADQRHCSPLRRLDIFYRGSIDGRVPVTRAQLLSRYRISGSNTDCCSSNQKVQLLSTEDANGLLSRGDQQRHSSSNQSLNTSIISQLFDPRILKSRVLCLVLISTFLVTLASGALILHLPALARFYGLSDTRAALLLTILGGGRAIGHLILALTSLHERFGQNLIFLYMLCITGCGLLVFLVPFLHSFVLFVCFVAAFGLLLSGGDFLPWFMLVQMQGLAKLTNACSWLLMFRGAGQIIGGPLFGLVVDSCSDDYMIGVMCAAGLLCIAGLMILAQPLFVNQANFSVEVDGDVDDWDARTNATTSARSQTTSRCQLISSSEIKTSAAFSSQKSEV